ncbi:MAG: lipoxygenase family protein [Pseudomonadota bacterium]
MINKLPQHEAASKAEQRKADLHRLQARYEYTYEYANTIAIVRKVPWREFPGLRYWFTAALNLAHLIPSLPSLLRTVLHYLSGNPIKNYRDYVFYPRSPQPNPQLFDNFQQDLQFGLQRVIGCNPVVLRAVSQQQPLPGNLSVFALQQIFSEHVPGVDYQTAVAQKRVYVLDYAVLAVLQQNPGYIDGGHKQHVTTPIVVLFQQDDGTLRPLAIQLDQAERGNRKIYTTKDGNLWQLAKTFAQIADGNHHILYTHAVRIHYVMEAIIMASRRQLHESHPLYVLLDPHLQFTLNVNHQHTFLKNRWGRPGRFGELFAGDYDATTQCMADAMTSYNFADYAFPKDIANREVDNPSLFYPYRDDGLLLWDAIQNFVRDYINTCYQSDEDVALDHEINMWAHDISAPDRGRIPGFPTKFASRQVLAETIGQIIFHCTAHHSSIHFNQYSYPGFVPNMPYASYVPPPTGNESDIDAAQLMRIQPGFRAAYSQTWTYYLTNWRVNRMGDYALHRFDPDAREVIKRFGVRLREIDGQIGKRNRERIVSYERMQPSTIPNSVTV